MMRLIADALFAILMAAAMVGFSYVISSVTTFPVWSCVVLAVVLVVGIFDIGARLYDQDVNGG